MKEKVHILLLMLAAATCMQAQESNFELRTLTFEDSDYKGSGTMQSSNQANWSSLIDSKQYQGELLYGSTGNGSNKSFYFWADENNTMLAHEFPLNWGTYCYWGGGHAISHYVSGDIATYNSYVNQLTVYKEGVTDLQKKEGGHNGSNNFCVHFGYHDQSGFSAKNLPAIYFYDGKARVIDHMWINNTCYPISCFLEGNSMTKPIGENDWVKVVATGFDDKGDKIATQAEFFLCNGSKNIVKDWTKFDLSVLGPVTKVELNITGSSDNGHGFSQPAYFAYDDVAVRFEPEIPTGIDATTIVKTVSSVKYINLQGIESNTPFEGLNIKVTSYSDGSSKTSKIIK